METQKVLVTGASGFVGQAVCQHLAESGLSVIKALRNSAGDQTDARIVGEINAQTDWSQALLGVDSIVHLAARVHVMHDVAADPLSEFRKVNVAGTVNLAQQAAQAGVRRLIFVSSIKVNGEKTEEQQFTEMDKPAPQDPYSISKFEAEQQLQEIAHQTGLEVVILRPPLIYGPRVKANFYQLMNAVYRGWPLPLGSVHNKRSLLYVNTFADAIKVSLTHPNAVGKTFLVSDDESVSTSELVSKLGRHLHRAPRLLNIPVTWMKLGGKFSGKSAAVDRLTSSLVVNSNKIRQDLGWTSPYSFDLGIQKTSEWFLSSKAQGN
ncbi:MAG TPA: SDR family oxidoreductase [Blastocatellia bacterium]|nr:SDR family oxidoreductase [Blastocatellia bacterium]